MTKDKDLEELFHQQKPVFDDHDVFMASVIKRLDAVEYIKRHQEATIRRYKMAMVAAFVVGIISGAVTIMYILSSPVEIPLFDFHVKTGFFLWLAQNSRIITATALALLMSLGLVSLINNIQEIRQMRVQLKTSIA
ncbi:MAG: hypothetical protein IKP33_05390 [Prevotella sp.]|nr:hypothetical protein [Prevotella sp.]